MTVKRLSRISGGAIGIKLDADALRLVRCSRQGELLAQLSYDLPDDLVLDSDAGAAFLQESLSSFCSSWKRLPLWLCATTPGLQLRFLRLQQVRPREFPEMVYWAFRKDIPFDAEKTIFDFGVHGVPVEGKVAVTVCTALQEELAILLRPFSRADIPLRGVVAPPFALAAFCARAATEERADGLELLLDAGDELATITIMQSGQVVGSRIFKTGLTPAEVRRVVRSGAITDAAGFVPVLDRLVQQVDRTMSAHLTAHAGQHFGSVLLTGALSQVPMVREALETQLGLVISSSQRTSDGKVVDGVWAAAYGAALSRYEDTPNFLHPVRARRGMQRRARFLFLLALLVGAGAVALVALKAYLQYGNIALQERLVAERSRLSVYDPEVNTDLLQPFVVQIAEENQLLKELADRWHPYAVLQILASLTPSSVRVTQIDLQMESVARRGPFVRVQGVATGAQAQQLPVLAAYVLDLEKHPFFGYSMLRQVHEVEKGVMRVLQFELEAELVPLGVQAGGTSGEGGQR